MTNGQRVTDYWRRVWSEGNLHHVHELFAARYLQNATERTPEQFVDGARAFRGHFDDFHVEVVRLLEAGDLVVSRVIYRARHVRDWPGVPAAGAEIEVSGLDVFRFEDGRIVEHLHEADHEAMWEQLGIPLPPG